VLVSGGVSFSALLDEQLKDAATCIPAPAAARSHSTPPRHPLLFTQPYSLPRIEGYPRPLFISPAIAQRPSAPSAHNGKPQSANPLPPRKTAAWVAPRPSRRLTASEQRALDFLNRMGAELDAQFTEDELRQVFRRLARQYHPDRHPTADAILRARLSRLFSTIVEEYRRLQAVHDRTRRSSGA
jgi:hypothetical protein